MGALTIPALVLIACPPIVARRIRYARPLRPRHSANGKSAQSQRRQDQRRRLGHGRRSSAGADRNRVAAETFGARRIQSRRIWRAESERGGWLQGTRPREFAGLAE